MNPYDGSPDELTYGQALCLLADKVAFGDATVGLQVLRAVQKEHGLTPPEPEKEEPVDPRDQEIKALKAQLQAAKAAELDALKSAAAASATPPAPAAEPDTSDA